MRRRTGYLIAAALVVGSVGVATLLVSLAPEPSTRPPPSQVPYADVANIIAGAGPIPVYGAGSVRPSVEVDIAPQVGGRVVWADPGFRSGLPVEKGQTLFRIEEADYEYRVRAAEAALAARRVALLEAREDAAIARAERSRMADRRPDEAAPEPGPLALRIPQLEAAEAAVKREEATLAQASLELSRTRVTAPFDGIVRDESVNMGQLLTAGQPVGKLFSSDAVEVVISLSDTTAALIPRLWESGADVKAPAAVRVFAEYGEGRYVWPGYVDRANASIDVETRTIDVIVRVTDPLSAGTPVGFVGSSVSNPPLLVGKFVEVAIDGIVPESYFRIRRAALQADNEIWTVGIDGTIGIVPVDVLQRMDDEVFVTGDLEDGQAAVTGGIRFATNGMTVRTGPAATP
ncbi:MAG: efflux RND transporter periplasmic adaptor subunit [Gammaproteobacteria bacterium]|nr:efflux RND transporter periplasmic adaptor subunit [Gammaproteobacteria bacterium]